MGNITIEVENNLDADIKIIPPSPTGGGITIKPGSKSTFKGYEGTKYRILSSEEFKIINGNRRLYTTSTAEGAYNEASLVIGNDQYQEYSVDPIYVGNMRTFITHLNHYK